MRNGRSGRQLARLRAERRLTQRRLGELAGFRGRNQDVYIRGLESGRYPISDSTVVKLCRAFGMKLEALERELSDSGGTQRGT
jgi:transcriptional regulator with XRE-family HTH domain